MVLIQHAFYLLSYCVQCRMFGVGIDNCILGLLRMEGWDAPYLVQLPTPGRGCQNAEAYRP